jgi:RNA polymerase sigma factor (sigma-70 family)
MTTQMSKVIQHLRSACLLPEGADLTDGQLLECFVSRRETAALEALVRRHAPMVWGVCLRILSNHHDAEDAFQAAFLVLVRKAASVTPREMVGNWLYGVAQQTARKARATAAKQRTRERQVVDMLDPAVKEQALSGDLQTLLDQELSRLPDKYRVAIVLCDLEGETRKQAARQLGLPEGTLAGRLTRGRAMLAKRLARHGLAISGGALAAVLSQKAASACVPTLVLSSTIKAVTLVATGKTAAAGLVSAKVATLTAGVLKAMLLNKLKTVMTVLFVALGMVVFGGGLYMHQAEAQPGPAAKSPAAGQTDEKRGESPPKQEQDQDKEGFTAWGKEIGGLQAGLGFHPGEKRAYSHGETVKLVVRVRNVGKEGVRFQYLRQFFIETPPAVTDGDGKPVPLGRLTAFGIHIPVVVDLAPGKEIELYELKRELRPASESGNKKLSTLYGTGKFQFQYERIFGNSSSGSIKLDPTLSKLATGKLELEIKSDPPPATEKKVPDAPVPAAKEPAWKAEFRKAYGLKDGEYVKRVPSPFIPERKDFLLPRFPGADEMSVKGLLAYGVLFVDADGNTLSYRAMVSTDATDFEEPPIALRKKRLSLRSVIAYSTGRMTPEVVFNARAKDQDVFMECDFVIRKGAPLEKLLPDLQNAIGQCEMDNPKTHPVLTLKEEEQEVYVVRGKFKITPRKWRNKDEVDVCADEGVLNKEFTEANPENTVDVETSTNTDPPLQFVRELGSFVNKRMVWDTEAPINLPFRAYTHQRWENKATAEEQAADRDPARVLKNVSEQTGLTFTKEKRKVQVLYVVTP